MNRLSKKIFVRVNGTYEAIEIKAISYVQAEGDYITIYLEDERCFLLRQSLNKLEDSLPALHFLRIHRSFLVNVDRIERLDIRQNTITLSGLTIAFPLNRSCRERLFELIKRIN